MFKQLWCWIKTRKENKFKKELIRRLKLREALHRDLLMDAHENNKNLNDWFKGYHSGASEVAATFRENIERDLIK